MMLGAFSISLTVQDLAKSKAFYETLGFSPSGGDEALGYVVMKNGDTLVGLYHGMFDRNMLTFNPGWDQSCGNVDPFADVRDIKSAVKAAGFTVSDETGGESGIGSFIVTDPDGNPVLIDQHR